MRGLGMRVFGRPVPGVPALGRLVPGNSQVPGNRWRRSGAPVLIAAAALLVVAAGSPPTGRTSAVRAPAPSSLAMVQPPPPGSPPGIAAAGGTAPPLVPLRQRQLLPADLLVVSATPLPAGAAAKIQRLHGVRAAEPVEAARVKVNGSLAAVLGVDPSAFRRFAAKPTALDSALWRNVANGAIAVSYTMGQQAKLPAGSRVTVAGAKLETLQVGGLGTVGIAGVDAVVSDAVARSLGFPAGNAIVISAPDANLPALLRKIKAVVPRKAAVELLVAPATRATGGSSGTGGRAGTAGSAAAGGLLSPAQLSVFLRAAGWACPTCGAPPGRPPSTAPGWCNGRWPRRVWPCRGSQRIRPAPGPPFLSAGLSPVTCSSTTPIRPPPATSRTWRSTSARG
jgi:hypothetical protein